VILVAADRLVQRGALQMTEDVFYLTADELLATLGTEPHGAASSVPDLASRAATRRLEYCEFRLSSPPDVLVGDATSSATHDAASRRGSRRDILALHGLGVSPGRAAGAARVVHTVDDLQALRAGEVIVAPATDPSWTSLLALCGALVLEMGGLLSHGAIVARELGIPAVVDVDSATSLVVTGDHLTVDGRSGLIGVA
jgi:pyruvate,water dikinase